MSREKTDIYIYTHQNIKTCRAPFRFATLFASLCSFRYSRHRRTTRYAKFTPVRSTAAARGWGSGRALPVARRAGCAHESRLVVVGNQLGTATRPAGIGSVERAAGQQRTMQLWAFWLGLLIVYTRIGSESKQANSSYLRAGFSRFKNVQVFAVP